MARPNIIIFVTDDQGYGDLGCHGNPHIRTPNMDRLHGESVRFTDFHVDPTCSPSRAAIMTGCYSHRVNVWHTIMGRNYLNANRATMPELFRREGYRTGNFGKWHLGGHSPYLPTDRGFEEWLGQGDGGTGCMTDHWTNRRVDDIYLHNGRKERIRGYGPDVFFDAAMDYMDQPDERPFFIYLATYIPHNPTSLPDSAWADPYREHVDIRTAYFYSAIERADHNLGRLRSRLSELGIADNTILLFMTDNGTAQGHHDFTAGMRGNKGSVYEGGHRVPCFVHWPAGGLDNGRDIDGLTGHIDLLPTLLDLSVGTQNPAVPEDLDGTSLAGPLRNPNSLVLDRTLIVESQRIRHPQKYRDHAVMRGRWRLVNRNELYNLSEDPGQQDNRAAGHPEMVAELAAAYEAYWEHVTTGDDTFARPDIADQPVNLCAEHLFPDTDDAFCWNQLHVLQGVHITGEWPVTVGRTGTYRIECRRWPEELGAPMAGVPLHTSADAVDTRDRQTAAGSTTGTPDVLSRATSWLFDEEVPDTLYRAAADEGPVAIPVVAVRVTACGQNVTVPVITADCAALTQLELTAGEQEIRAEMLDDDGGVLGTVYYVSVAPSV